MSPAVGDVVVEGVGDMPRPPVHDRQQQRVLRVVQPALAGMMDGSVSTLAPLFATALATRDSHTAFLVGVAAAAPKYRSTSSDRLRLGVSLDRKPAMPTPRRRHLDGFCRSAVGRRLGDRSGQPLGARSN